MGLPPADRRSTSAAARARWPAQWSGAHRAVPPAQRSHRLSSLSGPLSEVRQISRPPSAADPRRHVISGGSAATSRRTPGSHRFGPSMILAALFCAFLALPLLGLGLRAVGAGGLGDAIRPPIVLEAVRLNLVTPSLVLLTSPLFLSPL